MALLTVINIQPANLETEFNPASPIVVTFDKTLNVDSVNTEYVKLYEKETSSGVSGSVTVSEDKKSISFKPDIVLKDNTDYFFILQGDYNASDDTPLGLLGEDGSYLTDPEGDIGNYYIEFQTGVYVPEEEQDTFDETVIDTTYASTSSNDSTAVSDNDSNNILEALKIDTSSPKDKKTNANGNITLNIKWDSQIVELEGPSGDVVYIERVPIVPESDDYTVLLAENEALNDMFTCEIDSSNWTKLHFEIDEVDTDVAYKPNSEYVFVVKPRMLKDSEGRTNETEIIRILSYPTVKYANFTDIYRKIPSGFDVDAYQIEYMIIEGSLIIKSMMDAQQTDTRLPANHLMWAKQFVTCYVLNYLYEINNSSLDSSTGVIERELYGHRVKYGNTGSSDKDNKNPYEDCMDKALSKLGLNYTVLRTIKSSLTLNYPGRKRYISDTLLKFYKQSTDPN